MWPVRTIAEQKRRLEVLRFLNSTGGYEASDALIKEHLREIGVPTNSDEMAASLMWLDSMALVRVRRLPGAHDPQSVLLLARLTEAGRETSQGFRQFPGVMAPDP